MCKEIRKRLAHIDWNDKMKPRPHNVGTLKKSEIDSAIDRYFPIKSKENSLRRNICQNRLLRRLNINRFIIYY